MSEKTRWILVNTCRDAEEEGGAHKLGSSCCGPASGSSSITLSIPIDAAEQFCDDVHLISVFFSISSDERLKRDVMI